MQQGRAGFTLIELLVSLAVAALLLGVALPAFTGGLEAARASDARASLLASYLAAVNKAALTGTRAVLCPSADGAHCDASPDWSGGWVVFLDADGDRERDANERLVARQDALAGQVRLTSTEGRTRLVFQGNGGNAGSNVTFTICDGRGPGKAETLVLSNQGRLRRGEAGAAGIAATCPR